MVAQARASAGVLALLPLGFAVASSAFTRVPLVPSGPIAMAMGAGLMLDVLGLVWMRSMIRGVA